MGSSYRQSWRKSKLKEHSPKESKYTFSDFFFFLYFLEFPVYGPMLNTIFTQPLRSGRIWHKVNIFKRSLTGLNSKFSFSLTSCLTKAEKSSLSYYLPIAGGRIIGFIPFPRVLVLCEMRPVSSKIWTRVAVSISYDDNHYTTVLC